MDDAAVRDSLRSVLGSSTFRVRFTSDTARLISLLTQEVPDALILQETSRPARQESLIREIHARWPKLPIIAVTTSDLDGAVTSFRDGAFECLATPFDGSEVLLIATRACEHARALIKETNVPLTNTDQEFNAEIIGRSPAMREIFRAVARLAPRDLPVIIAGEPGSGKELIARALHRYGRRSDQAFVVARLTGLTAAEIDCGLFGNATGAERAQSALTCGLIAEADRGTLFLDQVTELSRGTQTRILQVLGNQPHRPAESIISTRPDIRLIGSVNVVDPDSPESAQQRDALAENLGAIVITIPPLRTRREDIPLLLDHHLGEAARELDMPPRHLGADAIVALCELDWPGNVAQLATLCRWITAMSPSPEVTFSDLPTELWTQPTGVQPASSRVATGTWEDSLGLWVDDHLRRGEVGLAKRAFDSMESVLITAALRYTRGHRQDAARLLGMGRNTLTRKMNKSARVGRGAHKA